MAIQNISRDQDPQLCPPSRILQAEDHKGIFKNLVQHWKRGGEEHCIDFYPPRKNTARPAPMVPIKCGIASHDNYPGGDGQVSTAYDAHLSLLSSQGSKNLCYVYMTTAVHLQMTFHHFFCFQKPQKVSVAIHFLVNTAIARIQVK